MAGATPVALLLHALSALPAASDPPGYEALVALFTEWRAFQPPPMREGVPDYTTATMKEQQRRLPELQARLLAIDTKGWPVAARVDWELVRAEMNGLDFDHRVLRPWTRDPAFYSVVIESESDTPLHEGPAMAGEIELWRYAFPLPAAEVAAFRARLQAIPRLLEQARGNLVGDARDLWQLGIRAQKGQSAALARLAMSSPRPIPSSLPDAERARQAVDAFVAWLEQQLPAKTGPSGVGVENYDWNLRNVHLVPMTWRDELVLMERELARSTTALALEEHRNLGRPVLEPPRRPPSGRRARSGRSTSSCASRARSAFSPSPTTRHPRCGRGSRPSSRPGSATSSTRSTCATRG